MRQVVIDVLEIVHQLDERERVVPEPLDRGDHRRVVRRDASREPAHEPAEAPGLETRGLERLVDRDVVSALEARVEVLAVAGGETALVEPPEGVERAALAGKAGYRLTCRAAAALEEGDGQGQLLGVGRGLPVGQRVEQERGVDHQLDRGGAAKGRVIQGAAQGPVDVEGEGTDPAAARGVEREARALEDLEQALALVLGARTMNDAADLPAQLVELRGRQIQGLLGSVGSSAGLDPSIRTASVSAAATSSMAGTPAGWAYLRITSRIRSVVFISSLHKRDGAITEV